MEQSTSSNIAALQGASKHFGSINALDNVAIDIRRGELLALLGANGAGKSTSIGLLLGLSRPDAGRVHLFGHDPQELAGRRRIGVMLQSANLPPTLRVAELLRLTASYYPHPRPLGETLELAGIADIQHRPCRKLSGGQQRRVQFALALCGNPELLFLDEPTAGMDVAARERVWQAMRTLVSEGCSIVLTTHYLEEAEALARRVVVLGDGRVVSEGSVDDLRSRVALTRVRCRSALEPAVAAAWPGVTAASHDAGRLVIATTSPEDVVRRLLQADTELAELEVRRAGLAEAVSDLTAEDASSQREVA